MKVGGHRSDSTILCDVMQPTILLWDETPSFSWSVKNRQGTYFQSIFLSNNSCSISSNIIWPLAPLFPWRNTLLLCSNLFKVDRQHVWGNRKCCICIWPVSVATIMFPSRRWYRHWQLPHPAPSLASPACPCHGTGDKYQHWYVNWSQWL
jgi:hypothetical protein